MTSPNLFLVRVADAAASTAFYRTLFEIEPEFTSPHYVAFPVAPGVLFAVWSGGDEPDPTTPRYSEIGLMLPAAESIDEWFDRATTMGARVVQEPHDAVFGRTCVVADPDGNHIRFCPID